MPALGGARELARAGQNLRLFSDALSMGGSRLAPALVRWSFAHLSRACQRLQTLFDLPGGLYAYARTYARARRPAGIRIQSLDPPSPHRETKGKIQELVCSFSKGKKPGVQTKFSTKNVISSSAGPCTLEDSFL